MSAADTGFERPQPVGDVCLVVPCYNEASRLKSDAFLAGVDADPHLHLLFVNDGSRDDTLAHLQHLAAQRPSRITVVDLAANAGKAEAVRQGMLAAAATHAYRFIGFWDADLSTPLDEVSAFLKVFERRPATVAAIGCRLKRLGSSIERNPARHYLGRVFATMASLTLQLGVYDSQCGAKMFPSSIVEWLFAKPFVSTWCFDVELLARLNERLGADEVSRLVYEVPLATWHDVGGSKLHLPQMMMMPIELAKIRRHYPPRE